MQPIIRVENLGKCYRIHHKTQERYTALRDVIARKAGRAFEKLKFGKTEKLKSISDSPPFSVSASSEDFWALKDINFEIQPGEVVGIIGRNGAGKSTLLKILSRITEPTTGRITLNGRVASLLEVGTGFHPELTGRENIFLNGAILGMSRKEIQSKFDEIVDFAGVEKFLDTPVKRYSSGMYVRLAFAVAAHLEPEILIIDEVLAVGDAEFQKKCLGKMGEVAKGGRTVLFVSHNMAAVQSLCTHTILMGEGRVLFAGSTGDGISRYLGIKKSKSSTRRSLRSSGEPTITFANIEITNAGDEEIAEVTIEVASGRDCELSIELRLFDQFGAPCGLASSGLLDPENPVRIKTGVTQYLLRVHCGTLARGEYHFAAQLAIPLTTVIDAIDSGLNFQVEGCSGNATQRRMEQAWGFGAHNIKSEIFEQHHEVGSH